MRESAMKSAVIAASLFLLLSYSWFIVVELILHHHNFLLRAAVAAVIVLYAALTLAYTRTPSTTLRDILTVAALTAICLGLFGLLIALRQTHFEGYLLLLALGLLVQSLLTAGHTLYPRLNTA